MAGSITVYHDGLPVTMNDRIYSFDSNMRIVNNRAFKTSGFGSDPVEIWRKEPAIRTVTGFLAKSIAKIGLSAYQRDGQDQKKLGVGDGFADTLLAPDRTTTNYEWIHTLVIDLCLWDRYMALVVTELDGTYRIVRVPPTHWEFVRGASGRPSSISALRADGTKYPVALDRCFWLDGYPADCDTSPMASLADILEEQKQSTAYRRELWANGGRFPGWISRGLDAPEWRDKNEQTGKSAFDYFREGLQEFAAGGSLSGNIPIIEDGMQYNELSNGITPDSAQQIETRRFSISEVAGAYHVHPSLIGFMEGNYSNASVYREILYGDVLGSWFEQIEQAFNVRAVPLIEPARPVFGQFNVRDSVRATFEDQAAELTKAAGAPVVDRNEARERLGLPPKPGADELVVPLNVLEGGQANPSDSTNQAES